MQAQDDGGSGVMGKLQDILSSVKSALTSDTAKGVAATIAAGHYGGSKGINAVGSAMDTIKADREQRKLDKVNEAKSKLEKEKTTKSKVDGVKEPKVGLFPKSGPDSLMQQDEEKLDKVKEKMAASGAKTSAEAFRASGSIPMGVDAWKRSGRGKYNQEIQSQNLPDPQANAMSKEMNTSQMPGFYEQNKAIVDNPQELGITDKMAGYTPAGLGIVGGAATGGKIGSMFGPFGAAAGVIGGGIIGGIGMDSIADYYDKSYQEQYADLKSDSSADDLKQNPAFLPENMPARNAGSGLIPELDNIGMIPNPSIAGQTSIPPQNSDLMLKNAVAGVQAPPNNDTSLVDAVSSAQPSFRRDTALMNTPASPTFEMENDRMNAELNAATSNAQTPAEQMAMDAELQPYVDRLWRGLIDQAGIRDRNEFISVVPQLLQTDEYMGMPKEQVNRIIQAVANRFG